MRIAHVGNVANIGAILTNAMMNMGHDVELWSRKRFRLPPGLRRLELRGFDVLHLHAFRLLPLALETLIPGYTKVVLHHHGSDVRGKGEPFGAKWAHHRFRNTETVRWAPEAEYLPQPVYEGANGPDGGYVLHAEGEPGKAGTRFVREAGREVGVTVMGGSEDRSLWLDRMSHCSVVVGKVTRWCGGPGVVNLEAMAMGKPTMCYMSPEVEKQMPGCPVIPVTPESFKTILRAVMSSADHRAELGEKGREYWKKHHTPEAVAVRCLERYHG